MGVGRGKVKINNYYKEADYKRYSLKCNINRGKNFYSKLQKAIIRLHKEELHAIVLIKHSDAVELEKIAQKERQTVAVLNPNEKRDRLRRLAIAYEDGQIHYFENKSKKKKCFLFLIQPQK